MTRSRRPTWRTVLVTVALVAGLVALHALSHHGEHVPAAGTTAHADHHEPAPTPEESPDHGVLGLCLAMLVGAAAWLLASAVRRRPARPLVTLPRRVARAVPLPAGRGHPPPGRWDLSVVRC